MGYSGAGGKLIHEKNQEQKISWHCPFKFRVPGSIPASSDTVGLRELQMKQWWLKHF